jgi:hypothetical protein
MKEKYIVARQDAAEIRDPELRTLQKPRRKLAAAFFAVPSRVLTIRTAKFLGWPVFSLDRPVLGFPGRPVAKNTGIFVSRAVIFLPTASSCKKCRHPGKETGHLSSWSLILVPEASSWLVPSFRNVILLPACPRSRRSRP